MPFDKLSDADFAVAAAYTTLQWADGPVMLDELLYGRKDAQSVDQCGKLESIPTSSNYVSNLQAKGFTEEEIVALASVEAFGVCRDPE